MSRSSAYQIAEIIGSLPLAKAIEKVILVALGNSKVHLVSGKKAWDIFRYSLDAAIRDINEHPRGQLFKRLIAYGLCDIEESDTFVSNGKDKLSPEECADCIRFIFFHMVNRFKGELAELLSIGNCISLAEKLACENCIPQIYELYFGDTIREPCRIAASDQSLRLSNNRWAKGADGLIISRSRELDQEVINIHAVIEMKSMVISNNRIMQQIDRHIERLQRGIELGGVFYKDSQIQVPDPIKIAIEPSTWRVSRKWKSVPDGQIRRLLLPAPITSPIKARYNQLHSDQWCITTSWSQEALEQAAYEMTFHYMAQVGEQVFTGETFQARSEGMTPLKAGYNAIKDALYYMLLFKMKPRIYRIATKLYNVYCFGYANGASSPEMLWPDDFSE